MRHLALACLLAVCSVVPLAAQEAPATLEKLVFLNEQLAFEPGYPIGDIAIGAPDIADFKVLAGRRQLLLFGKGEGQTNLIIWDQKKVKRHDILVTVTTREEVKAEAELRDLLKDFPSVQVRRVRGRLAVVGSVATDEDLESVQRIVDAAGAQNLARVARAAPASPGSGAAAPSGPTFNETRGGASTQSPAGGGAPAPAQRVTYDVELIEASTNFTTGTYQTGIEPSGPRLHQGTVTVSIGEEGEVFIPAAAALRKDPKTLPKGESGIRVKLRPSPLETDGSFVTMVTVETNLPVAKGTWDPAIWRRGRWELFATSGVPFGVAGADLVAALVQPPSGDSAVGKAAGTASAVTGLPGVSSAPGVGEASAVTGVISSLFGIWGGSSTEKSTDLFLKVRPQVLPAATR
jgi:hypothetical protein